jgi:hypothetical protein
MEMNAPFQRVMAGRVRDVSLRELLRWHGFEIKPEGVTYRAKNGRHNIVVTENRWFDNKVGVGGRGAIDLQMHLTDEDFAAACQTLATAFRAVSTAHIGVILSHSALPSSRPGTQALSRTGGEIRCAERSDLADCPCLSRRDARDRS